LLEIPFQNTEKFILVGGKENPHSSC
jgi:hypothetical protein